MADVDAIKVQQKTAPFKHAVELAKKLIDAGVGRFRIFSSGEISFAFEESLLEKTLGADYKNFDDVKEILQEEVAMVLFVVLSDRIESFTEPPTDEDEPPKIESLEVESAIRKEKVLIVRDQLVAPELKFRYLAKRASHDKSLRAVRWSVEARVAASRELPKEYHPQKVSKLTLIFSSPESRILTASTGDLIFNPFERPETISFEVDSEDVSYLITQLQRVHRSLINPSTEGG